MPITTAEIDRQQSIAHLYKCAAGLALGVAYMLGSASRNMNVGIWTFAIVFLLGAVIVWLATHRDNKPSTE
jgi:hypothetical protein